MLITYTAEGTEPEVWDVDLNKLMNAESEAIEKRTGMTYTEFGDALQRGSVSAMHALLWVLRKRKIPTLEYGQVQFTTDEVSLELGLAEKITARDQMRQALAAGTIDVDRRELARSVLAEVEAEIAAEQPEASADVEGAEAPKDSLPEPSSGSSGGLHSLPTSVSIPGTSTG